jgi:hypothetical protein
MMFIPQSREIDKGRRCWELPRKPIYDSEVRVRPSGSSSPKLRSLNEADEELNRVPSVNSSVPPSVLRQRRTALTATWNFLCYVIDALALDLEILNRYAQCEEDPLQAIIEDLPDLLAAGWDNRTWALSIDTSEVIAAVVDADRSLDLHQELVSSDLDDPNVGLSLLVRMTVQRSALMERKIRLEMDIKQIQGILVHQYAAGVASTDDWLT